jgi:hypothetical protein
MRIPVSSTIVVMAFVAAATGSGYQAEAPEPGVYADTAVGLVPLKQPLGGIEIAGAMRSSMATRALVFPISTLENVPVATDVAGFIVNLATVQDHAAAAAQMRFMIGERAREPEFTVMAIRAAKFRIGYYRISSPNLTRDWLAAAYAKMTDTRKWRDKRPRAIVGLILNEQTMYPVRIDTDVLTAKR